ncbi:hypothetical protein [Bosea sp. RAC05]|uniref:hypothetical protein n=1 Tax=Bosea sp. RAC05 TaxID=1842539 RepID=UPI00083CEE36|nr:hypothetical protein [Bosea sp. RAC05]AOG03131.1 hypothetical protein BSY19_4694 [Bosea sp. RAC05]
MRAKVLFEFPVTFVPIGSRSKKTEQFADVIEVDLREVDKLASPVALHASVQPSDGERQRDRAAYHRIGAVEYADIRTEDIVLAGHEGALWRDCWDFSRRRFHEILADRLNGNRPQDATFFTLQDQYASPTGNEAPRAGYLRWLDHESPDIKRSNPLVLKIKGEPWVAGAKRLADARFKELIESDQDAARQRVRDLVANTFFMCQGKLYERVELPVLNVRRISGGVMTSLCRSLQEHPRYAGGSAFFGLDERREFEEFRDRLRGRGRLMDHGQPNYTLEVYDRDYIPFDRTSAVIQSLRVGLERFAVDEFPNLPDEAMEAWMHMRRLLRGWAADEGDPTAVFDSLTAFHDAVPETAKSIRERFKCLITAAQEIRPMLDMTARARPVVDPDLDGLSI